MKNYLYLARNTNGVFKIGISGNVPARIKALGEDQRSKFSLVNQWKLGLWRAQTVETLVIFLMSNAGLRSEDHLSSREYFKASEAQMMAAIECALMIERGAEPYHLYPQSLRLTYGTGRRREDPTTIKTRRSR